MKSKRKQETSATDALVRLRTDLLNIGHDAQEILARGRKSRQRAKGSTVQPSLKPSAHLRRELTQRAAKVIEEGREQVLASLDLEGRPMRRLNVALQRLDIPSRRDIEELSHRVSTLERVLATLSRDRQDRKRRREP